MNGSVTTKSLSASTQSKPFPLLNLANLTMSNAIAQLDEVHLYDGAALDYGGAYLEDSALQNDMPEILTHLLRYMHLHT